MDTQTKTILALLVRHFLGWMAGALVYRGYLDSNMTEGFISAMMMLGTIGWSWWQKEGHAAVVEELRRLKLYRAAAGATKAAQPPNLQAAMAQQKKP